MIPHTKAYLLYKQQVTAMLDFAVVMSYSIPSLKMQMKVVEKGVAKALPKPDYFIHDLSTFTHLRERASLYKPRLSSYLWLSNFSFFEAFITGVVKEMIEFHDGSAAFIKFAELQDREFISAPITLAKEKRKLQEYPKGP